MATYIYNCKRCKTGKRVDYPIRLNGQDWRIDGSGTHRFPGVWVNSVIRGVRTYGGDPIGVCQSCGYGMDYGKLEGYVVPDHKCDARCVNARGCKCECSCGGLNHGAGWV